MFFAPLDKKEKKRCIQSFF